MEIPQPFNSSSFGQVVTRRGAPLPVEFLPRHFRPRRAALLAYHNLARAGQLRRPLAIPNPVPFFNLAKEVVSSWSLINSHVSRSPLSRTTPTSVTQGRAIVGRTAPPDRPRLRARYRANAGYVVQADVQQFYPSVYSHSIAWALHTKDVAKASRRDATLLGNRLDWWIAACQDQQTRGIPIGPDTSLVIAEILLTSVDLELQRMRGGHGLRGFRLIDDIEISCDSRAEAEEILSMLQAALAQYELHLNESKTGILELPNPLHALWPRELREFTFRSTSRGQISDLLEFFSLAFQRAEEFPKEGVLRYAVARVGSETIIPSAWKTYEDLLLQCLSAEPGTASRVLAELRKYQIAGSALALDRIQAVVEEMVCRHSRFGHGSEVAWAVWMAIALRIALTKEATDRLPYLDDPLVPLLALHADALGLLPSGLDKTRWAGLMRKDELYGEHWVLVYEANVKGWLPSVGRTDHVLADPCFAYLKRNKVSFYNLRAASTRRPKWRPRLDFSEIVGYGL
ncbi:RNA-directed DNA polymerase [Gemmatimonadota bacterium]